MDFGAYQKPLLTGLGLVAGTWVIYKCFRMYRAISYMKACRANIQCTSDKITMNDKPFEWYSLDDGVMGGNSKSYVSLTPEGHLHHKGKINMNFEGGGFCTSGTTQLNLGAKESHKGVRITYRGNIADIGNYFFSMTEGKLTWTARIPTAKDDSSITQTLLWKEFRGMKYGGYLIPQPA